MKYEVVFSIIIPVKEINDYIRDTVKKINSLNYKSLEIIILPNHHEKKFFFDPKKRTKIIPTKKLSPARKRDIGAQVAKGKYLSFLDDDSYPLDNYFQLAQNEFRKKNIHAIGGPAVTPRNNSFKQKISGAFFLSKISGGNPERYIPVGKKRFFDDWPSVNLIFRRSSFLKLNGYDNDYWPGEDTFLCNKLKKKLNKQILYVPNLIVIHHRREGLLRHLKQVGNYALHRGYFAKKYPENSLKIKYFIPSIFLFSLAGVLLSAKYFSNLPMIILFFSYFSILIKAVFEINKYESFKVSINTIPYIFLSHIFYGFNFLRGIFKKQLVSTLR